MEEGGGREEAAVISRIIGSLEIVLQSRQYADKSLMVDRFRFYDVIIGHRSNKLAPTIKVTIGQLSFCGDG